MAKFESQLYGGFDEILKTIDDAIIGGSSSASFEDSSDFMLNGSRCAVRVYERFSWSGGNRVSMNITLFGSADSCFISAITSGGSQAMLFKINTFGESAFLDTLIEKLDKYIR